MATDALERRGLALIERAAMAMRVKEVEGAFTRFSSGWVGSGWR
jgi:hypothetical protein